MPINEMAKAELAKVIAAIPPGKKGMLDTSLSNEGVRAEVGWYVKPNWSVSAYGERGWKGRNRAGVSFKGSW